jgi:hypothetical protein
MLLKNHQTVQRFKLYEIKVKEMKILFVYHIHDLHGIKYILVFYSTDKANWKDLVDSGLSRSEKIFFISRNLEQPLWHYRNQRNRLLQFFS